MADIGMLDHAQSLDPTARPALRPAQLPFAQRKLSAADRVADGATRALTVAEWLRTAGFEVIALCATSLRPPEIQIAGSARALSLVATGAAQELGRGRDDQGDYRYYELMRHGVRVHFVIPGVPL